MRDHYTETLKQHLYIALLFALIVLAVMSLLNDANAGELNRTQVKTLISQIAIQEGLEPELAVAIAEVESSLNPDAIGGAGELGVFQLHPKFHEVRKGDIRKNIRAGIKYLLYVKRQCEAKYGDAWFIGFNVGPYYGKPIRYPTLFPYYRKVAARLNRLAMN